MREQSKSAHFPLTAAHSLLGLEPENLLQSLAGAQCPGMAEGLCPCLWKRQMAHGQDLMIQLCCILPTELKTPGIILDCLCGPDKRCKKVKRDLASGKFGSIFCPSTGRCKVPVNALLFWQQQESDTKVIKGWELYPCV